MTKVQSSLNIVSEQEQGDKRTFSLAASDELKEVINALTSEEAPSESWIIPFKTMIDNSLQEIRHPMNKLTTSLGISEVQELLERDMYDRDCRQESYYIGSAYDQAVCDLESATLNLIRPLVQHGLKDTPLFEALRKMHPGTTEKIVAEFESQPEA
ncbi:hypothetical protein [Shimazuella kribbensis]|uniref:hypothetical protein n=1 Tax=Shimazuella kribbensis TaxID=139808 RepID=UPI00048CDCBF|nr:hypothetical protein [Shimazuella kribbensis]